MKYIAFILFILTSQCVSKKYHNHTLFRAVPVSENHLSFLGNLSVVYDANFWIYPSVTYKAVEFVIPPVYREGFIKDAVIEGIYQTTIIEDIQSAFDKQTVKQYVRRNMASFGWTSYFRVNDIYDWLKDLNTIYPDVMQISSIGKTYQKRDILLVKIDKGKSTKKSKVIVEGGIHAREWISIAFVTYFLHQILTDDSEDLKNIAEAYEWYFIPVLNPDGYEFTHTTDRMHRTNMRGVDINRNFGIKFGTVGVSSSKDSEIYCGPYAFSEAESRAMGNFIKEHKANLKYYLAFHSYGQYIILPYAYSAKHQDNFDEVRYKSVAAAKRISRRYGTEYTVGTAFDTVGYMTSGVSGCWVKKTFKVPYVLTFELRDNGKQGFALPPDEILPTCLETMDGLMSLLATESPFMKLNKIKGDAMNRILDTFVILWNVCLFIIVRFD